MKAVGKKGEQFPGTGCPSDCKQHFHSVNFHKSQSVNASMHIAIREGLAIVKEIYIKQPFSFAMFPKRSSVNEFKKNAQIFIDLKRIKTIGI